MSGRIENISSVVLVILAASMAGTYFYRTVVTPDQSQVIDGEPPTFVKDWEQILSSARPIGGDSAAPVTMVVFSDLECPACRAFHPVAQRALDAHPRELKVVFVHYPLDMHRFALSAARASECAAQAGLFLGWVEAVYNKQDSLGIKSWASYAADAGIADTTTVEKCAKDPKPVARIQAGLQFADKEKLRGTPTVMINGWRYNGVPSSRQIDSAVSVLARRSVR